MLTNIIITIVLVLLNAFFVAAEFAIVKVRESQIELQLRAGNRFATLAKHIIDHLDSYLSASQLGITLASLGLGWIGEPVVSKLISDLFSFLGLNLSEAMVHNISLPTAFVVITILHIVFGEQAPKSLAIQKSEQITLIVALPLRIFYFVFAPFIKLINGFSNLLLKIAGFPGITETDQLHSAEELRYILEESKNSGIIELTDHKLLDNIFDFADKDVKQIMVPRARIVAIDIADDFNRILDKFIEEAYSRMPVYEGSIDNIIGTINAKDIIALSRNDKINSIKEIIRKPFFVQEEDKIKKVLNAMLRNKLHIAVALDEFGGTAGIVTMEDIIEEIIGEIQDEYDEETPHVEKAGENVFIINTTVTIDDLNEHLPVALPTSEDYETLGGLITSKTGKIPSLNEVFELDNYLCTVLARSERKIEKVKLEFIVKDDESNNG